MSLSSSLDIELSYSEAMERVEPRRKLPASQVLDILRDGHDRLCQLIEWDPSVDYERDPKAPALNPLLWELGHIALSHEHFCLRWFGPGGKEKYNFGQGLQDVEYVFNSFAVPKHRRYTERYPRNDIIGYYKKCYEQAVMLVKQRPDCPLAKYSATLSALHAEMHVESVLYSLQTFGHRPKLKFDLAGAEFPQSDGTPLPEWARIPGGQFVQGWELGDSMVLEFDNECPGKQKHVQPFEARTTCATEAEMVDFIQHGGYQKKEAWHRDKPSTGWWLEDREGHHMPRCWQLRNDGFYRRRWDEWLPVGKGCLPVVGVCYYEADAVSWYQGGRLPTETEWEYMSTNGGTTRYPWGDEAPHRDLANLDYCRGDVLPVDAFPKGDNQWGIRQLFGNVWEWTSTPLHPYDGFRMDPLYREFTYPFMGFQNVVRGGSWTCVSALANSKYRNAQTKNCDYQYIGFRVVKDICKRKLDVIDGP